MPRHAGEGDQVMPLDLTILALNDEKLFRELCYIDGEWIGARV